MPLTKDAAAIEAKAAADPAPEQQALVLSEDLAALPPEQRQQLVRAKVMEQLGNSFAEAGEVLAGTRTWNTQQTKLFTVLLNKVLPDAKPAEVMLAPDNLNSLTQAELEAIVAEEGNATVVSTPSTPSTPIVISTLKPAVIDTAD